MNRWAQLRAMAWYEARMHWRRRGFPVILIAFAVVMVGVALVQRAELQKAGLDLGSEPGRLTITYSLLMTGPIAWVVLALTLPPVVATAVPQDKHLRVRELLDSLPVSRSVYLTGKLLGVWSALLLGLLVFALLLGLAWRLILGPYDLALYGEMWLLGIVPMALYATAVTTLLPAGLSSQRGAVMFALVLAAAAIASLAASEDIWLHPAPDGVFNPSIWLGVLFSQAMNPDGVSLWSRFADLMPKLLAAALLQIALAWLVGWLALQWQEARSA